MRPYIRFSVLAILLLLSTGACGATPPSPTPTADVPATQTALAGQAQTESAVLTSTAEAAAEETSSVATSQAEAAQATRQAAEREAAAAATARAQGLYDTLLGLVEEGYVSTAAGEYFQLPDFAEAWAQLNYYDAWPTGFAPQNFVVRGTVEWDVDSDRANWWNTGCGWVFRFQDWGNHYLAYLALDGNVYFQRYLREVAERLGSGYYGKVEIPSGTAQIMLAADGPDFTFFVNDEKVHSRRDNQIPSGALGFTLVSGTNRGFGTSCKMADAELWILP